MLISTRIRCRSRAEDLLFAGVFSALFLCILTVRAADARAQPALDLLSPGSEWSVNTDHADGARMKLDADGKGLRVTIQADGGREDYPKARRTFSVPQDWRAYARMHVRMRAVCQDPEVRRKQVAFVFYDEKTRRADYPGHPMKQQSVAPSIPVNRWIDRTYWLSSIHRSAIRQLDLYLYEGSSARPHTVQWEFAALEMQRIDGSVVVFDGEVYEEKELRGVPMSSPAGSVRTRDRLGLTIDRTGSLRLEVDGETVRTGARDRLTGLLVRDVNAGGPPRAVGGEVRAELGVIRQRAEIASLGLRLNAEFRAQGGGIDVRGEVADLRGKDRAVTVMFAVPVDAAGAWQWWDSMAVSRTKGNSDGQELSCFEENVRYGLHGRHSKYPLSALSFPRAEHPFGLSLAIRMDEPVAHRLAWNPRLGLVYIAFDFGLVPAKRADGRSLAVAPFHLVLYRHDPAWGFRSALERYYRMFPEFFRRRTTREGGWYVWGNMADTPDALAAGFAFHWGPRDAKAVKWDNAHGVPALYYIESETYQQTMEDVVKSPSYREVVQRLDKLAAGDKTEIEQVAKQPYKVYPLAADGGSVQERIQETARIVKASLSFDEADRPYCSVGKRGWMSKSRWGAIMACNLDPAIPGGKGGYNLDRLILPALESMRKNDAHYDGIALDSLGGYGQLNRVNYRREHFRYVDAPLSFSAVDHRPVQVAAFGTVAWLRQLARVMHSRGKVLMANCSWGSTPAWLMFAAPYLDVFGAEAPRFADPDFIRAIAYRKACTDLPYKPRPAWEVPWHWLHGIYPGVGNDIELMKRCDTLLRELTAAGWEPITGARAAPAGVRVERFGGQANSFLVVHNPAVTPVRTRITLSEKIFGKDVPSVRRVPGDVPVGVRAGRLELGLAAQETLVLRVGRSGQ